MYRNCVENFHREDIPKQINPKSVVEENCYEEE